MTTHRSPVPVLAALVFFASLTAPTTSWPGAPTGSPRLAVAPAQLDAGYWIGRDRDMQRVVLDKAAIATANERMRRDGPSLHDVEGLGDAITGPQARAWIEGRSARPTRALYDERGQPVTVARLDELVQALALDTIPARHPVRHALVVRRADLRTFPSRLRVFSAAGDTDIDRFQETALFPATPVAVLHESRGHDWAFVVAPDYSGWVARDAIAVGGHAAIFDYVHRAPYRVITGANVRTVHAPGQPALSELALDMGVRLPEPMQVPADGRIDGQHAGFGWPVELPVRDADGSLRFAAALLPATADVASDYLPLTRANILDQAFKFLGERYGWGHAYGGRDCSGFVAEVYRAFGLHLPRNTGDQARIGALGRVDVGAGVGHADRLALLRDARAGDLVFVPGHVMMLLGEVRGEPWVIHDIHGANVRAADGSLQRLALNAVVVTPLLPLLTDDGAPLVDRITAIQRVGG